MFFKSDILKFFIIWFPDMILLCFLKVYMYVHVCTHIPTHFSLACNCEDMISLQVYPNENISFLCTKEHVIILSCIIGYNSSLKWRECNNMSESKQKNIKRSVFIRYFSSIPENSKVLKTVCLRVPNRNVTSFNMKFLAQCPP